MRDMGIVKFDEPFTNLFTQGMLTNDCYYREEQGGKTRWFYPGQRVDVKTDERGKPDRRDRARGRPAGHAGRQREDVEVEEQTSSSRARSSSASAPTPHARSRCSRARRSRARRGSDSGAQGVFAHSSTGLWTSASGRAARRTHPARSRRIIGFVRRPGAALRPAQYVAAKRSSTTTGSSTTPWCRPAMKMLNTLESTGPAGATTSTAGDHRGLRDPVARAVTR